MATPVEVNAGETTGPLPPFSPPDPKLSVDPYPLYRLYRERERVHVGEGM